MKQYTTKFTPGKWQAKNTSKINETLFEGNPFVISDANSQEHNAGWICHLYSKNEEARANAELIAAAPDLLDACKKTLIQLENAIPQKQMGDLMFGSCERLREAIEKAEGVK